jgi:hypothetical protein
VATQPGIRLISPDEGSTDAAYHAGSLTLATDANNFAIVQGAELVSLTGQRLRLKANDLTQSVAQTDDSGAPVYLGGQPAALGKLKIPSLQPSTTYELVLKVRTVNAPASCPKALTERIARFTTEPENAIGSLDLTRASSPPAGTFMSGPEILRRTRVLLQSLRYPPFISFVVNVRATIGSKPFAESFQSIVRTRDDIVATHTIPFASTNKPENPYGTDIMIFGLRFHPGHSQNHEEPFGVPQISPLYSFGLRPPGEILPSLFPTPEPEATDIRTLGRIETFAQDYEVTLAGIEPYAARYAYHLALRPVHDPGRYRLRDIWIDTKAFVPRKLRSAGIFPQGLASSLTWDVSYTIVNGYWLMDRESTDSIVHTGGGLAKKVTAYDGLTYSLSDFTFPKHIWDFSFFNSGDSEATEF